MKNSLLQKVFLQEDLNFLLTNRIPRHALTRFMGWYSKIDNPWLTRMGIWVWRHFTDLDLSEAKPQRYRSLHACFTRELKEGARPIDPRADVLTSPCDAIVGEFGTVKGKTIYQAKGYPYAVNELFGSTQSTDEFDEGIFVTLRLTSAMYHRFHAPTNLTVNHVTFIAGDTWNVNPIALKRIERLFCKNERAVIRCTTERGHPVAIVPVAAILVASLRLKFVKDLLNQGYRGEQEIPCDATYRKGEEMGWFEHGSTIILFLPKGFEFRHDLKTGQIIRMGQSLAIQPR